MSIENRLAAKKRSAKARRNAKLKAAAELGVIILIPVVILIIVLAIYNNSIPQYSRYLDKEGNIKGYKVSKQVELADLDAMGITYDKYKPTDAELESAIASNIKTKVEAEEKAAEESKDTKDGDSKDGDSKDGDTKDGDSKDGDSKDGDGGSSSNSTTEDKTDDSGDTVGAGNTTTTGEADTTGETEAEKTDEEKAAEEKAKYLAMFTDENVEKYFAEDLGDKYDHTVDGYRKYCSEKMQLSNFNSKVQDDILLYLEENSTIRKMPSNKFMKLWKKLEKTELQDQYERYKNLYASFGYSVGTLYEFYDDRTDKSGKSSEEYFAEYVEEQAKIRVKDTVLLLAVFDKLGFTYDKSEADEFIETKFVSSSQTLEDAKKLYGDEYMILVWKTNKAINALCDRIHVEPTEE